MNNRAEYGEAAREVCAGRMAFAEFAKRTDRRWSCWAGRLMRQWGSLPAWLGEEDLHQELLTEVWRSTKRYDKRRSIDAGAYVQFAATKSVAKIVHRARGVEQHRRHGPSRHELAFGDLSEVDRVSEQLSADEALVRLEQYKILRALCETRDQLAVITALEVSGGTLEAAAAYLYADADARFVCELVSEEHAASTINRVVVELVKDYGMEEAQS